MKIAETVTFGGSGLDRAAELRADEDRITALSSSPRARWIPLWRGRVPVAGERGERLVWLEADHPAFRDASGAEIFLGLDGKTGLFARDISSWEPADFDAEAAARFFDPSEYPHPSMPVGSRFVDLRRVMARLSTRDAELAAMARGLIEWHRSHGYCARCGQRTEPAGGGWQRRCPGCGRVHFPRTDPVVIMLITHGNSVLVGRSHGWPEKMYSLLAGFVEPGETIEAAVRREVFEEAGIRVGAVEYLASQPWPFPASLMIGCRGEALTRDITIDPVEIEDAMWITREDLLAVQAGESDRLLPARRGSIAQFLIINWLADKLA